MGGFLLVAVLIVITPGADMALVARNTLSGGRPGGVATSVGVLTGLLVHGIAATIGLSAIIAASATVFSAVKALGALYLIWLGIRSLLAAGNSLDLEVSGDLGTGSVSQGWNREAFREGLVTNVLNPKISILFLSLMPQFINDAAAPRPQIAVMTGVFLLLGLVWLIGYVAVLERAQRLLSKANVRRRIDQFVGVALIAFGARLLLTD